MFEMMVNEILVGCDLLAASLRYNPHGIISYRLQSISSVVLLPHHPLFTAEEGQFKQISCARLLVKITEGHIFGIGEEVS